MKLIRSEIALGLTLVLGVYVVVVLVVTRGEFRTSLIDDAMISMDYGRTLFHHGQATWWPQAPRVQGFSSPLWVFILGTTTLLASVNIFFPIWITIALNGFLVLATSLLISLIIDRVVADRRWTLLGLVSSGFVFPLLFWSVRGTEFQLLVFFVVLLLYLLVTAKGAVPLFFVSFLVASTRPEVGLIISFVGLVLLATRSRVSVRPQQAVVLIFGPISFQLIWSALSILYFGSWRANTYVLKIEGNDLSEVVDRGFHVAIGSLGVFLVFGFASLYLWAKGTGVERLIVIFSSSLTSALYAYSLLVGGDAWEYGFPNRFLSSSINLQIMVILLALFRVISTKSARNGGKREIVILLPPLILLSFFSALFGLSLLPISPTWNSNPSFDGFGFKIVAVPLFIASLFSLYFTLSFMRKGSESTDSFRKMFGLSIIVLVLLHSSGNWFFHVTLGESAFWHSESTRIDRAFALGEVLLPNSVFATPEAGLDVYFSNRPAVDLTGKNDASIAKMKPSAPFWTKQPWNGHEYWPGHNKWDNRWSVNTYRPDLIVDFHGGIGRLPGDLAFLKSEGYKAYCLDNLSQGSKKVYVRSDGQVRWELLSDCS